MILIDEIIDGIVSFIRCFWPLEENLELELLVKNCVAPIQITESRALQWHSRGTFDAFGRRLHRRYNRILKRANLSNQSIQNNPSSIIISNSIKERIPKLGMIQQEIYIKNQALKTLFYSWRPVTTSSLLCSNSIKERIPKFLYVQEGGQLKLHCKPQPPNLLEYKSFHVNSSFALSVLLEWRIQ